MIIARVWAIGMRVPTPYGPPVQPVFTSQTRDVVPRDPLAEELRVDVGCSGRNGAPKQVLNVAFGSVTPFSVPATFAV